MLSRSICFFLLVFIAGTSFAQDLKKQFPLSFKVTIKNPSTQSRDNVLVVIPERQLNTQVKGFNTRSFVVIDAGQEIASQYNFEDAEHRGIITVLTSLAANENRELEVRYQKSGETKRNYKKRTQAELSHKTGGQFVNREYQGGVFKNVKFLRVPPEHKDHSWFIRYEGPGWESDIVGYRFYLDQRNATDVFGKKTSDMVLQQVGLDGFDSYHNLQSWGMDVMKVGKSLGLGSIGALKGGDVIRVEKTDSLDCRITENGNVYSSILTNYYGWDIGKKVNVRSSISIHGGTRLTRQSLVLNSAIDSLCTGIVKDKNAQVVSNPGSAGSFGFIATYGKQSLNNDELWLAVFFDPRNSLGFFADEFSHGVALRPADNRLTYYFMASWVQEPGGFKDEKEFLKYVEKEAALLANPVTVSILKDQKVSKR
jgi:hypothetical protein